MRVNVGRIKPAVGWEEGRCLERDAVRHLLLERVETLPGVKQIDPPLVDDIDVGTSRQVGSDRAKTVRLDAVALGIAFKNGAIVAAREMIKETAVDRAVVFLAGHFLASHQEHWIKPVDGQTGLPLVLVS